jgi:cephalosporin-C deacetylase-like acetyl esterase
MYYTINMFIRGRTIQSSDVTDFIGNGADAGLLLQNVCDAHHAYYAELANDGENATGYNIIAWYRDGIANLGDCA